MRAGHLLSAIPLCVLVACGGGGGDNGGTNPPPPAPVSSVSLSKTTAVLKPTESTTITATPKDASGNALSGRTVTWAVSPTSGVVDITPNGASVTVTATANGQAVVTATSEQKSSPGATITVSSTIATSADVAVGANGANAFDPAQVDVAKNGTVTFNWNGVTHNVTWQSPPAQVANITDRSSGSVPVTFSTSGTYNYQCTIHPGMNGTVTVH